MKGIPNLVFMGLTMTDQPELKLCRWCDSDNVTKGTSYTSEGTYDYIECKDCRARGPATPIRKDLGFDDAITAWNTRAEPDKLPEWVKNKLSETIINCRLLEEELRDDGDGEEAIIVSRRANTLKWVLSLTRD